MTKKYVYRSIDIVNSVSKLISTNQLIQAKDRLLLATSGGQDSISLLVVLNQLAFQMDLHLSLFWCNHLWQIDSFSLMRQIAKISFLFQMDSCFVVTFKPVHSELLARNWRYSCSYRVSLFYNCHKISLAHSGSDRVETILLNLMRGTGTTGLSPLHWTKKISEKFLKKKKHISRLSYFSFFCWSGFMPHERNSENIGIVNGCGMLSASLQSMSTGSLSILRRTQLTHPVGSQITPVLSAMSTQSYASPGSPSGKQKSSPFCFPEGLPGEAQRGLMAKEFQDLMVTTSGFAADVDVHRQAIHKGHFSLIFYKVKLISYSLLEEHIVNRLATIFFGVKLVDTTCIINQVDRHNNFEFVKGSMEPTAVGQFGILTISNDYIVCDWSKRWGRGMRVMERLRSTGVIGKRQLQIDNLHFCHIYLKRYWRELFLIATSWTRLTVAADGVPVKLEFPSLPFYLASLTNFARAKPGVSETSGITNGTPHTYPMHARNRRIRPADNISYATLESSNFFVNIRQVARQKTGLLQIKSPSCVKTKNKKWFHRISSAFFKRCYSASEQTQPYSVSTSVKGSPPEDSKTKNMDGYVLELPSSFADSVRETSETRGSTSVDNERCRKMIANVPLPCSTFALRFTDSPGQIHVNLCGADVNPPFMRDDNKEAQNPPSFTCETSHLVLRSSGKPEGRSARRIDRLQDKSARGSHWCINDIDEKNTVSSGYDQYFQSSKFLRRKNCIFVRPFLSLSRFETGKMCLFWKLPVYPDRSNQRVHFLRNRVRKQLLPTIKLFFNPQIENVLLQFAEITLAEDDYMNQIANRVLQKFLSSFYTENQYIICADAIGNIDNAISPVDPPEDCKTQPRTNAAADCQWVQLNDAFCTLCFPHGGSTGRSAEGSAGGAEGGIEGAQMIHALANSICSALLSPSGISSGFAPVTLHCSLLSTRECAISHWWTPYGSLGECHMRFHMVFTKGSTELTQIAKNTGRSVKPAEQGFCRLLWQGLAKELNDVSTNVEQSPPENFKIKSKDVPSGFAPPSSAKTELSKPNLFSQRIPIITSNHTSNSEFFSKKIVSAQTKNQTLFFIKKLCLASMIASEILHFAIAADEISESSSNLLRHSEAQLFTRGLQLCLTKERFDAVFAPNLIIHFNRLKIKTYSPLIISSLPLALQRRVAKLFLANYLSEEIRYSQIEKFLAMVKKITS